MTRTSKFKNMSFINQIRLTMIAMSLIIALIGTIGLFSISHLQQSETRLVDYSEHHTRQTAQITIQMLQCRRFEKDLFLNLLDVPRFESYLNKWTQTVTQLSETLIAYRDHCSDPDHVMTVKQWLADVNHYQNAVMTIVQQIKAKKIQTPQQANLAMMPQKNSSRTLIIDSLNTFNNDLQVIQKINRLHQTEVALFKSIVFIMLLLVVIGGIVAMVAIPRRIVDPLQSLSDAATSLRDGNLDARVSTNLPNNELGKLGKLFNEMAQQLQRHETQLRDDCNTAESLNRTKTRFLTNISHELRTPLTTILGFAECLHQPDMLDESAKIITQSSKHLLQIVTDLLQLTEIETKQFRVYGQQVQLIALIMQAAQEIKPACINKQLQLILPEQVTLEHDIYTDPLHLKGILDRLLNNAVKFTEHGSISIHCRESKEDQCFVIKIQDTGKGMTPLQIQRAHQLFELGDDSLTRPQGGLGNGLALSKRILEYLEGQLSIQSKIDTGTCITLTLPFHAQNMPAAKKSPPQATPLTTPHPSTTATHPRVLIADDTPDILKLTSSLLNRVDIKTDHAENGQIAVDMAMRSQQLKQPYDLIIMDMQMPQLDGYQATRHLRQHGYSHFIVALTAHALNADRQKCLDAGCNDYITKPIKPKQFIKYVQNCLEQTSPKAS